MSDLFDRSEFTGPQQESPQGPGVPRLRTPFRQQVEIHYAAIDDLLESDHPARAVWAAIEALDLSLWLAEIRAVEGHVGRDATDPRLLIALWVYATIDGVGSARRIAKLCEKHLDYLWLCGGVSVNYHLLADYRSQGGDKWDRLLTQIVASLMAEGLVKLTRVSQDGVRVRAQAGKSSFRGQERLQECLEDAQKQVEALKQQEDDDSPHDAQRRQRAARQRAAEERAARLAAAIQNCEQLQAEREASAKVSGRKPTEARASMTDPEARIMKFANGGYDPGYNVQFAVDTDSRIIVGVDATNAGTDSQQAGPMLEQLQQRYGRTPKIALYDGGFATQHTVDACEKYQVEVFMPLKDRDKQLKAGMNPFERKKKDNDATAAWRERMGTPLGRLIYPLRAMTSEWINAVCRNRGLRQAPVRGSPKCRIWATLHAVTHNLLIGEKLRAEVAVAGA
jgi:transposase